MRIVVVVVTYLLNDYNHAESGLRYSCTDEQTSWKRNLSQALECLIKCLYPVKEESRYSQWKCLKVCRPKTEGTQSKIIKNSNPNEKKKKLPILKCFTSYLFLNYILKKILNNPNPYFLFHSQIPVPKSQIPFSQVKDSSSQFTSPLLSYNVEVIFTNYFTHTTIRKEC